MMKRLMVLAALCTIQSLAGAAEPNGNSPGDGGQIVRLSFPNDDKALTAQRGGAIYLWLDYVKSVAYSLATPLETTFNLLWLRAAISERLYPKKVDETLVYCSEGDVLFNKTDPSKKGGACFLLEGDSFTKVTYATGKLGHGRVLNRKCPVIPIVS